MKNKINIAHIEITKEMYAYLQQRFYRNNHAKYRKYFEEWVQNVTEEQLMYFEKEKFRLDNNIVLI